MRWTIVVEALTEEEARSMVKVSEGQEIVSIRPSLDWEETPEWAVEVEETPYCLFGESR